MKLRNRLGLVLVGIIIFLIITPILVLYARGFKVDWENKTLVKTGALVVRTEPSKAIIYLNDEPHKSDTPANVRFLLPDDYNIRVEKEGYQSWTKRLTVKSQLVTWANLNREYITLFLSNPNLVESTPVKAASVSRNQNEIIFLGSDQIGRVDINNGEVNRLVKINNPNLSLLTSNTEIRWQNSSQVLNVLANKSNLDALESQASKIQHIEIDNGNVVVKIDTDLYLLRSGVLVLIDRGITDFTLERDDVWYVQNTLLRHYNISGNKFETVFSELPASKTSRVIRTSNQIYLILDNKLYLFNGNLETIYSEVSSAVWDDKSNELIYWNNHEIYLYNPGSKNSTLILRSLTPIQNPVLNKETGYIFYQNENKIKAIEIDDRDHRNIFTIADALETFTISEDGNRLYTISDEEIKQYLIR